MKSIRRGEPQPEPCPECNDFMGYQVSDYIKTHYTDVYNRNGFCNEGFYSDYQPIISRGKSAFCSNCLTRLPFKIKYEKGETK